MLPFDIWRFPSALDPYRLVRLYLFQMDAEKAHDVALNLLVKRFGPRLPKAGTGRDDAILNTKVCGLDFDNPLGLAAGFDKNAVAIHEILALGFGFVEVGTITPLPQAGNPQPRVFRVREVEAVINRLGFNSDGMDKCLQRLAVWHDFTQPRRGGGGLKRGLVGVNIGINKECLDPIADYAAGYKRVAPYASYVTVNISSPNTPGLRNLQLRDQLSELLRQITDARAQSKAKPPIFVKIAPDLNDAEADDIAAVVSVIDVQGMIVSNTTTARPSGLPPELAKESGGLSGKPLFEPSTVLLTRMHKLTQGKLALIGCGGVSSGADAYAKIRAGASLVQLYTALVYQGPGLVHRIKRELAALLRRDGFSSVTEAVGQDK